MARPVGYTGNKMARMNVQRQVNQRMGVQMDYRAMGMIDPMEAAYVIPYGENGTYNMKTGEYNINGVTYDKNMNITHINGMPYEPMKNVQIVEEREINPRHRMAQSQQRVAQPQQSNRTPSIHEYAQQSRMDTVRESQQPSKPLSFREQQSVRNQGSQYYMSDYDKKEREAKEITAKSKEAGKGPREGSVEYYEQALEGLL